MKDVLPRYRYAVLVNDARKYEERMCFGIPIARRDIAIHNSDIADGGSRPLRLDMEPFFLPVAERFSYRVKLRARSSRTVYVKDVLVWTR